MRTGQTTQTYTLFVGVDIAATTAAVSTLRAGAHASRSFTIDQTPKAIPSLCTNSRPPGMCPPASWW